MPNPNPTKGTSPLVVAQVVETMTMGGAENLAVRIANALPAQGVASHLIVITDPDALSERISPEVQVHYLRFHRASIKNPLGFLFSVIKGYRQLAGIIKHNKIKVAQTHLPGANFWGLLLTLGRVCDVFTTIHNNQEFNYGDTDSPVRQRLRGWAYRAMVNKCRGTIAVSAAVKQSLAKDLNLGPSAIKRISVVTNGVNIPEGLDEASRNEIRAQLGLKINRPFILAAGRFGPQKNFGDLLDVAHELKVADVGYQLVIAGQGEQLESMQAKVQDLGLQEQVFLPGNLQNLNQVMLAADAFVMTSLWEGLPLVLLEAMAAGLPAVAYGIDGVTELVREGQTGYVVPVGDTTTFTKQLTRLLAEQDSRSRMGSQAKSDVTQKFNFADLVKNLHEVYSAR